MSRLLLKAFLGPFAVTLPVALFILDMQFLWVYADDLVGKGLELWVVFKLMVFASARLVNLALPLAVLVASIMAMGNLAERSELTAMKASGMSFSASSGRLCCAWSSFRAVRFGSATRLGLQPTFGSGPCCIP